MLSIRAATADDLDFLADMLVEAAFWRPGQARPTRDEALALSGVGHYVDGFPGPHDAGVVASSSGALVGAAWWRFLPGDDPGYGWLDEDTPEVAIGVAPDHRGQGVGTALLVELHRLATAAGLPRLSLSVERDNPAVRLYERAGYEVVRSDEATSLSPGRLQAIGPMRPPPQHRPSRGNGFRLSQGEAISPACGTDCLTLGEAEPIASPTRRVPTGRGRRR